MEKYQNLNPNNSCIFIDFKNKESPVKFDYVENRHVLNILFNIFLALWFNFNFILVLGTFIFVYWGVQYYQLPSGITFASLGGETIILIVDYFMIAFIISFFVLVVLPITFFMIFKSQRKHLPEINTFYIINNQRVRYTLFKPEDIKNNTLEIPLFSNKLLDFKVDGEMKQYLDKFEITEINTLQFNPYTKKVRKRQKHSNKWKAIWSFSQQPKSGEMWVKYK